MTTASGVCRGPVLQLPSSRVSAKRLLPRRTAIGAPAGNIFVKRDVAYNRSSCHHSLPLRQRGGLQAAVMTVTPILDDEEKRKQMAEDYGFTQIGEQLPDNVPRKDVMDTLPKEVLLKGASDHRAKRIRVHVLTDGRDVLDGSSIRFVEMLEEDLARLREKGVDARVASSGGRMYVTSGKPLSDKDGKVQHHTH